MRLFAQSSTRWVVTLLIALWVMRLAVSHAMSLFGDEAFYWLESQHPALGYSDLPPLTAWMIALGTAAFGHGYLPVRSLFSILGASIPLWVWLLALEYVPRRQAVQAALLSLCLPLAATLGVLALPDVPLNVLGLVALLGLVRGLKRSQHRWWLLAGLAMALGLATHYRFAVPVLAFVAALLSSGAGRQSLRTSGPWLAMLVAMSGLIPIVWFNWTQDMAGLQFQLADRHPWEFQSAGLWQPLQQMLVTTPPMYLLLVVAAARVWLKARASGGHWSLLLWAGVFPPLFYLLVGLWADQERTTFHWPLGGYLVLCVMLPEAMRTVALAISRRGYPVWARGLIRSAPVLSIAVVAWVLVYLLATAHGVRWRPPDNAAGWSQVADRVEQLRQPGENVLADNFMLAAELGFELAGERVVSLDHPLNHKHGRAAQLAIWGLDESGLSARESGLLVVEETALGLEDRPAWVRDLCSRFAALELIDELALHSGRTRFGIYRIGSTGPRCRLPAFAYLDHPHRGQELSGTVTVSGWAFRDVVGLDGVQLLLDGELLGQAEYGQERAGVVAFFASTDPYSPKLGFEYQFETRNHANGRHQLTVRSLAADGYQRDERPVAVVISN